jgi:phosphotransferase system  glucose/maltose/N-acetylglucosamine-specific IIC component
MISARITGLFRFLIGILLLQGATALLTYTALMTDLEQTVWLFAALAAFLGLLVALWFDSVIGAVREQTMARQHKRHTREREKLKVQAERERAKLAVQKRKAMGGARLRTGVAVGGVVGVGIAMMLAQFMTMGLLTVATAGGAALGYGVRARQEKRIRAREAAYAERLILDQSSDIPRLEGAPAAASTGRRPQPDKPVS